MKNNKIKKIDIVYTWVDGNDKNFLKRKIKLQNGLGIKGKVVNKCRYTDNDELKYSLRSLEKFANWINNIYIITNNQCPKWLNIENSRIKLINQKDIMPENSNPNFNSNAIEHCIINIPNLSNYFLYANDDNMFMDYVRPEFFFKNNKPIYRFNKKYNKNSSLYCRFLANSEELIYKKFGKRFNRYPHHNIEPYVKKDMIECYKIFKEEIDKTIFSPFRKKTDIQKSIYTNFALATNKGYFKKNSRISTSLPFYIRLFFYFNDLFYKESKDVSAANKEILWEIIRLKPKLFCINDNEITSDNDRKFVKQVLNCLFPEKSQFEKGELNE